MNENKVITVGDWMLTLLVLAIPVLNIIMYIFWSFSKSTNINKKNFCRASLIWCLIIIVLSAVFYKF